MLPIARIRGTFRERALAIASLRRRVPLIVALAWLGALACFVAVSRTSGAFVGVRAREAPTFVVANQIFCVEAPPVDQCVPDDALSRTGRMRISGQPCEWQPPICGNDRRQDDAPASACVQVPVLTRGDGDDLRTGTTGGGGR